MTDLTIKLESNPKLPVTWKSKIEFHTYSEKTQHLSNYYQAVGMKLSYTTLDFYIEYDEFHNNPWTLWCSAETHRELWGEPIESFNQEILDYGKPFDNYRQIQGWLVNRAYILEEAHYKDQNC
jgi:hypothetical protein